ncbi:MAG TPA: hypothetical protein VFN30_01650 [Chitinophagaceae bacterium]|nr:hypothetical protein [Chitinophagaceae bacterium]
MKKYFISFCAMCFLFACKNDGEKKEVETPAKKASIELPYTASYSSSWSNDISDADLKMVLMTYKDWENNNMTGLAAAFGDTLEVNMYGGDYIKKPTAEILKMFSTSRDSLSSVKIDMQAWNKMYSTDKKESYIVAWYSEIDTYKTGKIDSADYHDINQVKNGKITWYSQYKRPKK